MTSEEINVLLDLAEQKLKEGERYQGTDLWGVIGCLEAARIPLETLENRISQKIVETVDYLIDEDERKEVISAGVRRVIGLIQTQRAVLETAPSTNEQPELLPRFHVSETDQSRIFKLCAEMRKIIFATTDFDEPHRLRLLNRLAAIEAETKKPQGLFDVVRGGINDLGETLGKFGKDVKPLSDRMKEVVNIARSGSKQYDQLPEPEEVKRLPAPEDNEA